MRYQPDGILQSEENIQSNQIQITNVEKSKFGSFWLYYVAANLALFGVDVYFKYMVHSYQQRMVVTCFPFLLGHWRQDDAALRTLVNHWAKSSRPTTAIKRLICIALLYHF
jgi:hypothetical protein